MLSPGQLADRLWLLEDIVGKFSSKLDGHDIDFTRLKLQV